MKIKCRQTSAKELNLFEVNTITRKEFDFGTLGLQFGEVYLVMAMVLFKDTKYLYYLIDINGKPNWFPNELFELVDGSLPSKWSFRIYSKEDEIDIYCIWGYDEICNQDDHFDQLIERDREALNVYFRNKMLLE
jgi:hypothetical protein